MDLPVSGGTDDTLGVRRRWIGHSTLRLNLSPGVTGARRVPDTPVFTCAPVVPAHGHRPCLGSAGTEFVGEGTGGVVGSRTDCSSGLPLKCTVVGVTGGWRVRDTQGVRVRTGGRWDETGSRSLCDRGPHNPVVPTHPRCRLCKRGCDYEGRGVGLDPLLSLPG